MSASPHVSQAATPAVPLPETRSAPAAAPSGGQQGAPPSDESATGAGAHAPSDADAGNAAGAAEVAPDASRGSPSRTSLSQESPSQDSAAAEGEPPTAARKPRAPRVAGTRLTALTAGAESGFPWERSPLAGIPSTKILAELQRRRERSATLLAERDRIVELMQAIESELDAIGHDIASGAAQRSLGHAGAERAPRAEMRGKARKAKEEPGSASAAGDAKSPRGAGRRGGRGAAPGARRAGAASGARRAGASSDAPRGARGSASSGRARRGATRAAGAMHPTGSPRAARSSAGGVSLRDAIALAVEPRALVTPAEAAELVRKNGYASTAKNFGMLVANTLARDERFRRVGRGSYERIG